MLFFRRRLAAMNQLAYRRVLLIVVAFLVVRLLVLALHEPEIVWGDQLQYIRIANSNLEHGWLDYLDPGFVLEAGRYYPYFKNSPDLPDGKFNPIFWDPLSLWGSDPAARPGLHASCLKFIRDSDCCLLVWDMMDFTPNGYDLPWSVHGSIFAYGIGLLDNALLQPLAEACMEEGSYEFLLTVNPLRVVGGTGSPVNPVSIL